MLRLRETKRQSSPHLLRTCPTQPSIRVRMDRLNIETGLLVTINPGCSVIVCVNVTCRSRFLANLRGHSRSVLLGNFITLSSLRICPPLLRRENRLKPRKGLETTRLTDPPGPKSVSELRKTTRTPCPRGDPSPSTVVAMLTFLQTTRLVATCLNLITVSLIADPLDFDLFIKLQPPFLLTNRSTLLIVVRSPPPNKKLSPTGQRIPKPPTLKRFTPTISFPKSEGSTVCVLDKTIPGNSTYPRRSSTRRKWDLRNLSGKMVVSPR